jgi:NAD(P)-dependent dehydrogenase (short-subunit alcohol dehydrogenase family)
MNNTLFDLSGRCALVTGGSKGLGRAIATAFASAGADLAIASRHQDELAAAADAIRQQHKVRVEPIPADLYRRDEIQRLADAAIGRLGRVDILVNNAGTNVPQPIDQVRDEDWDRVLQLNLTACMALTRALVPGMRQRRWGRIIHISSIMGLSSKEGRNSYSATKSALIGMARASALDLGPFGITVNCLAPGIFATDLPMSILTPEEQAQAAARTALGRWGQPHELAGAALLLASDAGSYITGSVLLVDGGLLCRAL